MHVRRAALVLTLTGVVALSPLACDSPAKGEAKPLVPDATALATVESETLLTAARRTRDAAATLVATCRLVSDVDESSYGVHDECTWSASEESAFTTAAAALRDLAGDASTTRVRGPAAMFVDQARLFADWVQLVHELPKRGTLAHYQELALAWNAWRPAETVASDPIPLRFPSWTGIDAGPDGAALRWDRCATGVCIVRKTSPR